MKHFLLRHGVMTHTSSSKCKEWWASAKCRNIFLVKMWQVPCWTNSEANEYRGTTVYHQFLWFWSYMVMLMCLQSYKWCSRLESSKGSSGLDVQGNPLYVLAVDSGCQQGASWSGQLEHLHMNFPTCLRFLIAWWMYSELWHPKNTYSGTL